jgi:hypothetical protein
MPERPLLLFPTPQPADWTKLNRNSVRVHKPNVTRQGQRLSPMFNQLQSAFEARRVELQQNTAGIDLLFYIFIFIFKLSVSIGMLFC